MTSLRDRISRPVVVAAGVMLLVGGWLAPAAAQPAEAPRAEGRRMLDVRGQRFGGLPSEHPVTARVRRIFDRVASVAGPSPGLVPEVHVLDTERIIGEALKDGIVVVSRGLVDLAGSEDDILAFILGHELAHVVRGHHELVASLTALGAGASGDRRPQPADQAHAHRGLELEADRLGVLFAALAGYHPPAPHVLVALMARLGTDALHPDPQARARAVREQVVAVAQQVEVFHLGLSLMASGRYRHAAEVLRHFHSLFPSREVQLAIGVAYHREALRYASEPEFRHTLVVDAATRAPATRSAQEEHPSFREYMHLAQRFYADAERADRSYAPALSNQAAAHLDRGDRDKARSYARHAVRVAPHMAAARNTLGVVLALDGDLRQAEHEWREAARLEPRLFEPAMNLARLLERTGRAEASSQLVPRAQPRDEGPSGTSERIAGLVPGTAVDVARWLTEPGARQFEIVLGRGPGEKVTLVVAPRSGLALSVRGGVAEAVAAITGGRAATVAGVSPGDDLRRVEHAYGRPRGVAGIQALQVWQYPGKGIAVFAVNGRVRSIWAGQPQGVHR